MVVQDYNPHKALSLKQKKKNYVPVVGGGSVQSQCTDVSRAHGNLPVMASVGAQFFSRMSFLAVLFLLVLCLPPGGGQKKKEVSPEATAHTYVPKLDALSKRLRAR